MNCYLKTLILLFSLSFFTNISLYANSPDYALFEDGPGRTAIAGPDFIAGIVTDKAHEWEGVLWAAENLSEDFGRVTGRKAPLTPVASGPSIIVGTIGRGGKIDSYLSAEELASLDGAVEKYLLKTLEGNVIIAGSDKRGTTYGIYALSSSIGVSPWYWWADVPSEHHEYIYIKDGCFTEGEPKVTYRGIFLNDEAPALTGWVNENTHGYKSGFYKKVFELLLRLKGNFMWPAMWDAAFYDDDPLNMYYADTMGIIMGTSHHEPCARAQKEWHRYGNGIWDYNKNRKVLEDFWSKGIERMKDTEDVVTIGMRGDGDMAMEEGTNIALLEKIITPRNYKWLNCNQVERVWEQMNLCWEYGVRKLWVVNVGDLKPMEYPIQFFLDMAWDPESITPDTIHEHTVKFAADQFGQEQAAEIADIIKLYSKYARRVTPELLNSRTYSFAYDEWPTVLREWNNLETRALRVLQKLDAGQWDAYEELVLFPVQAMQNVYEMYYSAAMNAAASTPQDINYWADRVEKLYERDSLLCAHYNHEIAGGKWNHMMDQTHIGYTYWQQPRKQVMPKVSRSGEEAYLCHKEDGGYLSIEAGNFSDSRGVSVIPDLGKTQCGLTTLPAAQTPQDAWVEYSVLTESDGKAKLSILLAPTLNFNAGAGLRYAVSVDGGEEVIVNYNGHYKGELGPWQAASIIPSEAELDFGKAGRHSLRFRFVDAGVVLEKIMVDFGGLQRSYLGAPSSELIK